MEPWKLCQLETQLYPGSLEQWQEICTIVHMCFKRKKNPVIRNVNYIEKPNLKGLQHSLSAAQYATGLF